MKRGKKKIEEPTFYCETCGQQVGAYEDKCPHCGMPFYGVRCPQCGFNGKARQFVNGCPRCGYKAAASDSFEVLNADDLEAKPSSPDTGAAGSDSSPIWLLLLVVLLFGILVAAVIVLLLL